MTEDIIEHISETGPKLVCLIEKNSEIEEIKDFLEKHPESVHYRLPETLDSPLHIAVRQGSLAVVKSLIEYGHIWNEVNKDKISAGELAEKDSDIYEYLLNEGCRCEMILNLLERKNTEFENEYGESDNLTVQYLSNDITYSDGKLLDSEKNAVMMAWEAPLMKRHAEILVPRENEFHVLNIGFGLGIIDSYIQQRSPKSHTIIEAHPKVLEYMKNNGWYEKENVRILEGTWQDCLPKIMNENYEFCNLFDSIFFDTFSENYQALYKFHSFLPQILKEGGIYTFFNGLGGTNQFFYNVYSRIVDMDLAQLGFKVEFENISMNDLGDGIWQDTRREYWSLPVYKLPVCNLESMWEEE
ncbi:S-adenosyl-L-methionine-dependent methyltransferase [Rozella allomycis CSF55]|uniref:Arginine N-methyltransferase 2 n=1 Tax=Rozella allomycis (strain CSF55) TaxID=988480 RepID=A0A4P9YIE4_ROZAC|nr:S-adenosyl-L-methionine-dependent methyltransferase [Rozella allomycis CSF55]